MRYVTLYIAKDRPKNTIPVRYWRLLRLWRGHEIALTKIERAE